MKVLLTGGTGLIGKALGKALVQAGHQVVVVSRNRKKAESDQSYPATVIEADLLKTVSTDPSFHQVDAVIHLAGENVGEGRWTESRKNKILSSRTQLTQNLILSLGQNKNLKTFISASAIGIYGSRGDEELSEKSAAGTGFLTDVCQKWEASVTEVSGVRKVILRTGVVFSSDGGALQKMLLPFRFGLGSVLGSGKQWISWIHLQDLVDIYVKALSHENFTGIYNAVAPNPVTNRELTEEIAKQLHKITGPAIPGFVLKIALGEMASIVLDSQKVRPERLQELGHSFHFPDLATALKDCLFTKL